MKRVLTLILIILALALWPSCSEAAALKDSYPRLANYFLKWDIDESEVPDLAKWDLLILDMETQENSRDQIMKIRALNPRIIILAYLTSQEILDDVDNYNGAYLRQELNRHLDNGWWLRDARGNKVSNWPYTSMFNLSDGARPDKNGQRINDYLPEFVVNNLQSSGLWDGVFYDNTWGDINWVRPQNLDLDNNGVADTAVEADQLWSTGFKKMLEKTRRLAGPSFIIVGNGRVYNGYQSLINGMMLENFPSTWENGGTWSGSMKTYQKLPTLNVYPQTPIINVYDKNQTNYRYFRYGLASALLGDGFYSFDYDVTSHGQTWWYDEYDLNLGKVQSAAYNLLNPQGELQPGLWRRDFKNGIALVNSTDSQQKYIFNKEEFEKIKGTQDTSVNNGQKVNYVSLAPKDGLILLKKDNLIKNSVFTNGYFFRFYNSKGQQSGNGFFSYASAYPGEAELLLAEDNNGVAYSLSAAAGQLRLFKDGHQIVGLKPFGPNYKKSLSLSARFDGTNFNKIIIGAGSGGGPQVLVFSGQGCLESNFFAYNKKLRGGVNVAYGDVDNDGQWEIVTGPGQGSEPLIKIFTLAGRLKASFLSYDSKFRGGVNVVVGDLDNNGSAEIITAPASGGGPHIRIFNSQGKNLGNFFAYDKKYHGGIRIGVNDINNDGRLEIVTGLKNFY